MLLAAVLLKMGTYGLVRLPVATVPDGFGRLSPVLAVLGVVGIVWGALVCLVERDLKRLIAYSSVAHMGFVALALAAGTETGLQAALFANIAHGVISALLFVLVGGLKQRWGSVDLLVARPALRETSPRLGFLLVLGLAASLGLPGLAGFWGEFLSVYAAWAPAADRPRGLFVACAVVAAVGAALAAAYALRVRHRVGRRPSRRRGGRHARHAGVELAVLGVLGGSIVLGVVPGPSSRDGRRCRADRGGTVTAAGDLVTVDAVVLAPALLPALGALLVLVGDAVVPGRRSWARCSGASCSSSQPAPASAPGLRPRRRPCARCASRPGRRLPVDGRPDHGNAAGRHPARDRRGARPAPRRRAGPRDTTVTTALLLTAATGRSGRRRLARPRHLAGGPRARDGAARGARRAARHPHRRPRRADPARDLRLTSFALLVLGSALWLTATGDASFAADTVATAWADPERRVVLVLARAVLLSGLGFKLSLVPFHAWTPQAYSTADLGTAAALATASKVAAAAALLVVAQAARRRGRRHRSGRRGPGRAVAVASMLLGNVMALRQDDATRLLAWSTVAQAGWVVLPVAALTRDGIRASAAYVLVYAVATLVAFAAVARRRARDRSPASAACCAATGSPAARSAWRCSCSRACRRASSASSRRSSPCARPSTRASGRSSWSPVVAVVLGIAVYLRWFALLLVAEPGTDDRARRAPRPTGPPGTGRRGLGSEPCCSSCSAPCRRCSWTCCPDRNERRPRRRWRRHAQALQRPEDGCPLRRHVGPSCSASAGWSRSTSATASSSSSSPSSASRRRSTATGTPTSSRSARCTPTR